MSDTRHPHESVSTGLETLDGILAGGYARNRIHLIEGRPGSGKTTLALQFLAAGREAGDRGIYITLSESREELRHVAKTHGLNLDAVEIRELVPPELTLNAEMEQSVVYAADLELNETINLVMKAVEEVDPTRVVFDSLSEIRLLTQEPLRYRRQVLALKHFFTQRGCTVLFLDDVTAEDDDVNLHSLVHGVIRLEQIAVSYGGERRRLRVLKMRARGFAGGFHDYKIRQGGLRIFPRLAAGDFDPAWEDSPQASSGLPELDALIGGGLDRGTNTLLVGPAGAGKSTLAMQFVIKGVERGEKALFLSFEETARNFQRRNGGIGIDVSKAIESGMLIFRTVDPAELTPGEMTNAIREHVEAGVSTVVLDSITGYQHAMPEEKFLLLQMHELLTYLNQHNILTFLVLAQGGMVGETRSPFAITYLADTVLLLRYFEVAGRVRRAISVIKRRTGGHEITLREFRIQNDGIHVGRVLSDFSGILTGSASQRGEHSDPFGEEPAPMPGR
ncbi:circadian clock protein KaiC [Sphingomonas koreensis]|nr:circadian clock protein KaiC [Sphingomonas koreensis]